MSLIKTGIVHIESNEIKRKKKPIPILPPSPKIINTSDVDERFVALPEPSILRSSAALFDPDNASPVSDFIHLLKLRMSIYYEPEMNILGYTPDKN